MLKFLFAVLLTAVSIPAVADADALLDEAYQRMQAGDYPSARRTWDRLAAENNPAAIFYHSLVYENSVLETVDLERSARLCRQSAELGFAEAQARMGFKYLHGLGVPRDIGNSIEWYLLAAEQDQPEALGTLGNIYIGEAGIPGDLEKSRNYWERAVAQGHVDSTHNLGVMYERGQGGLEPDLDMAIQLYNGAADAGSIEAMANLLRIYSSGEAIPVDLEKAYFWCDILVAAGREDYREYLRYLKGALDPEQRARVRQQIANWHEIKNSFRDF